jgi:hypothetical protein
VKRIGNLVSRENDYAGGWLVPIQGRQTSVANDEMRYLTGVWKFGGTGSERGVATHTFVCGWAGLDVVAVLWGSAY